MPGELAQVTFMQKCAEKSLSGHRSRRFSCREVVKRFWMYWRGWACAEGMLGNDEASEIGVHQTGVLYILLVPPYFLSQLSSYANIFV